MDFFSFNGKIFRKYGLFDAVSREVVVLLRIRRKVLMSRILRVVITAVKFLQKTEVILSKNA